VKSEILNAAESVLGRRALWRLGRNLYQQARAETCNDIATNGEGALQRRMAAARAKAGKPLVVFDVGANVGDWTLSLLAHARAAGCQGARGPRLRAGPRHLRDPHSRHRERPPGRAGDLRPQSPLGPQRP